MYHKAHFDWDQLPPLTSPRHRLGLRGVALGLINLPPGEGYTFTHRHREQEEVYMTKSSVALIGMPGAGKSTVGVVLAKRLGLDFVDTDLLLQRSAGGRLQQILAAEGPAGFRAREEGVLVRLQAPHSVIATGGSVVYGAAGMAALARQAHLVWLQLPLAELERRIGDLAARGVVIEPGISFAGLYAERQPLYRRYAELVVDVGGRTLEQVVAELVERLTPLLADSNCNAEAESKAR